MAAMEFEGPASAQSPLVCAAVPVQDGSMGVDGTSAVHAPLELDPDLANKGGPCLSKFLGCVCCPITCLTACTKVDQNEQKAVLYWGQYMGTLKEPGIYFTNSWGRELRTASTKYDTLELKDIKVVDAKGNPVIISGVVTYTLTSAKKACIDVANPQNYVRLQATTAMKQVASKYPYTAPLGSPSLQTEGLAISSELQSTLQKKTLIAGAKILSFEIVDLSYAREVAQVMLVKQQAEALIEARRLIVGAAVDMTQQAIASLSSTVTSATARERITSNLLSVICSHSAATPTVPLETGSQ